MTWGDSAVTTIRIRLRETKFPLSLEKKNSYVISVISHD